MPMTEEDIRSTLLTVLGDSGCVLYTSSHKKPVNKFINICEHDDWPTTKFLPKGGETPGTWIPQLEREIQHAIESGVFGLRESPGFFMHQFPTRVCSSSSTTTMFLWGAQGEDPFTLSPQLHDLSVRLFNLGRRWQSPIYVCSVCAEGWNMHPSIDGIGDMLRRMAQAEGWMTHCAEGLWEACGWLYPPRNSLAPQGLAERIRGDRVGPFLGLGVTCQGDVRPEPHLDGSGPP